MFSPRLSPDNSNVAVLWNRNLDKEKARGLWIISLKNHSQKLLMKGRIIPLNWSKDGNWIYVTDENKTPTEIIMVSTITGFTKLLNTLPTAYKRENLH